MLLIGSQILIMICKPYLAAISYNISMLLQAVKSES